MTTLNKKEFLQKYHLEDDVLDKAELEWNQLIEIFEDYSKSTTNLETTARFITENLRQVDQVHSLKYRVKDPEHLIEKIIRKKREDKTSEFRLKNYREIITDLIGVRALHLFKADWIPIHAFITKTWDLAEKPTANIRKGDSEELIEQFRELGCTITEHKYGYRSVHYLVESQLAKQRVIAEVQVRTIFEEGWSEIDHQTRYPYNVDNIILGALLSLFNRLAGSADEMGTFIDFLRNELDAKDRQHDIQIKDLTEKIAKLEIDSKKKEELQNQIDRLTLPYKVANAAALRAIQVGLSGNIEATLQAVRAAQLHSLSKVVSSTKPASPYLKKIEPQAKPSKPTDPVKDETSSSQKALYKISKSKKSSKKR